MGLNNASIGGSKKYHQSLYRPVNISKYIGDPSKIICRSSWEAKFCHYCDNNPLIMRWGSEVIEIPYKDAMGKPHRYYPDFYIEVNRPDLPQLMERAVIEVKPAAETTPPDIPVNANFKQLKRIEYQMTMWQKNFHKWAFAVQWCQQRDYKFVIVTEHDLKKFATMLR